MPRVRDMTTGRPARHILAFCLPIAAGNILQQLYNLVDALVIGRGEGVAALAAVSGSGWLDWLVLSIAMGLAQGFGIQIAQSFGAGDHPRLRRAVGQSILLSIFTVIVLEITAQTCLTPMLRVLDFPENTVDMTRTYLRVVFAGLPLIMAYNLMAGFLHAVGDSRTPLLALTLATVCNILLDILLVMVVHLGVTGAALATTASQAVSSAVCLLAIWHLPVLHASRQDLKPDPVMMRRLIRLGAPIAFQNLIISLGGLVLQRVVNGFGFIFMAGYNAASRLQGMLEMCGTAIGNAMGTFAGQNLGAGRTDRIREGLRHSAWIATGVALTITAVMILFGRNLLSLFVEDDPEIVEQVLLYGYRFLIIMASGLPFLYLLFVFRSTLQGIGDTFVPMLSGGVELICRIASALILPLFFGEWGVYFSEITAWIGAAVLLMWGYRRRMRLIDIGMHS